MARVNKDGFVERRKEPAFWWRDVDESEIIFGSIDHADYLFDSQYDEDSQKLGRKLRPHECAYFMDGCIGDLHRYEGLKFKEIELMRKLKDNSDFIRIYKKMLKECVDDEKCKKMKEYIHETTKLLEDLKKQHNINDVAQALEDFEKLRQKRIANNLKDI